MADEPGKLDISDEMIAERRDGSGKMPDDMPKWMAKSITSMSLREPFLASHLTSEHHSRKEQRYLQNSS